jgi:signal transduction histidine kinase
MRALAAVLVVTWLAAVGASGLIESGPAAALTGVLLLVVAGLAVQAARVAKGLQRPAALDLQVTVSVALPVAQMVLATFLFAAIMFVSAHDAILIVLVVIFAGALGVLTARMVTERLVEDVQTVRDGLVAVGAGRRDVDVRADSSPELADLARAANAMTERLASVEAARRDLVAAISHDLRTPMTSLRLVATALRDEVLAPEERRQYLDRMALQVGGLAGLVDDLFELSRLDAGDVTWSMQPVSLGILIDETVEAMQAEADAKGVTLRNVAEGLPQAWGDPEKLQRVLFNLVHNAIRHTPAGGTVTLTAETTPRGLQVEVSDTGEGVPEADRDRVFEAFYQGGDGASRGRGGGLGLAISRSIVEGHGGAISLEPAARGTRVRFSVPAWSG